MFRKIFTLQEANAVLPIIREELVHLQALQSEFRAKCRQLESLREEPMNSKRRNDEIFLLEASIDFLEMQARQRIEYIESQGILIKSIDEGLVDFPAKMAGEDVLLCWRQGEEKISYYHGIFEGYAGRKRILFTEED